MSDHDTGRAPRYKSLAFFGYPRYRVGSDGSVWRWVKYRRVWKKLKPVLQKGGGEHLHIWLCHHGDRKEFSVHRLVLLAFVGSCPPGKECCHNNGIGSDNRLGNLRWDTSSSNRMDAKLHGDLNPRRGRTHPFAKMDEDKVLEARRLYQVGGKTIAELAIMFGVSSSTLWEAVKGKTWTHI